MGKGVVAGGHPRTQQPPHFLEEPGCAQYKESRVGAAGGSCGG